MWALLLGSCLAQAPSLETLKATAEQMPDDPGAQSNYGVGLKSVGRLDEAMERFNAAIALDPTYGRAYNNMGNAFQAMNDYESAVAAHGQAIALEPKLASAYSNLGNALREMGQNELAIKSLMSAVSLNPNYAAAYTNLGSATMANGEAKLAAKWHGLAAALHGFKDPSSLNNLGAALEADGKLGEAADAFDMALKLQPGSAVLQLNRGNIHRKLGELKQAVAAYTNAIELEPDGADAHTAYNNVAAALLAEGNLERSLEAYEMALSIRPDHDTAKVNRDKLPISVAYIDASRYESMVLANRAARAMLATGAASNDGQQIAHPLPLLSPALHKVTRYLRRLETKQLTNGLADRLWSNRGEDMPGAISSSGVDDPNHAFTLSAFAWGGVWYQTLASAFTHPECRAALQDKKPTVVLGSSIGFEAYFTGLTYGVPTVGVELLCSLTELSEEVRSAHRVPTELARFECADALRFKLPKGTGLVYVDDTAWDEPTIVQIAERLSQELPRGAIVVHNQGGYDSPKYRHLASYEVGTSWNAGHSVHAHAVK